MRKQKQIWSYEHKTVQSLPSEMIADKDAKPSNSVIQFYEWLNDRGITTGKAIDIGAGKGRNTYFLAEKGFEIFALDYIQEAVDFISEVAKFKELDNRIHTFCKPIDEKWPFADIFFDIAIDSIASADPADVSKATNYVSKALSEAMSGQPVSEATTKPYGCSVKY